MSVIEDSISEELERILSFYITYIIRFSSFYSIDIFNYTSYSVPTYGAMICKYI